MIKLLKQTKFPQNKIPGHKRGYVQGFLLKLRLFFFLLSSAGNISYVTDRLKKKIRSLYPTFKLAWLLGLIHLPVSFLPYNPVGCLSIHRLNFDELVKKIRENISKKNRSFLGYAYFYFLFFVSMNSMDSIISQRAKTV